VGAEPTDNNELIYHKGVAGSNPKKGLDKRTAGVITIQFCETGNNQRGGDLLGSVIKKRRKKMRKHKHRKLLARTRHQRRKGK
jgi:hypothetical protein